VTLGSGKKIGSSRICDAGSERIKHDNKYGYFIKLKIRKAKINETIFTEIAEIKVFLTFESLS